MNFFRLQNYDNNFPHFCKKTKYRSYAAWIIVKKLRTWILSPLNIEKREKKNIFFICRKKTLARILARCETFQRRVKENYKQENKGGNLIWISSCSQQVNGIDFIKKAMTYCDLIYNFCISLNLSVSAIINNIEKLRIKWTILNT